MQTLSATQVKDFILFSLFVGKCFFFLPSLYSKRTPWANGKIIFPCSFFYPKEHKRNKIRKQQRESEWESTEKSIINLIENVYFIILIVAFCAINYFNLFTTFMFNIFHINVKNYIYIFQDKPKVIISIRNKETKLYKQQHSLWKISR